jgi:Cof subfamily protein (haloacid dehalogenase superfamily)
MKIKILFVDVDGTLFDHKSKTIPKSAIDALEKVREHGIKVFFATGRNYSMLNDIGVTKLVKTDGGVIINGAVVINNNDILYKDTFDLNTVNQIFDYANKHEITIAAIYPYDHFLINEVTPNFAKVLDFLMFKSLEIKDLHDAGPSQLIMAMDKYQEIEFRKKFDNFDSYRWREFGIDVLVKGTSKARGVKKIMEYYNVTNEECICFGDGSNDTKMFELCKNSVAMGNAKDELKKLATYVTENVENDGLYKAIKHFGLI